MTAERRFAIWSGWHRAWLTADGIGWNRTRSRRGMWEREVAEAMVGDLPAKDLAEAVPTMDEAHGQ